MSNEQEATVAENAIPVEQPQNAFAGISEEYVPLVESKGFKGLDDVLKSYKNLESLVGGSIRLPNEDSSDEMKQEFYAKLAQIEGVAKLPTTDEEKAAFYNKLGRPEAADGYELPAGTDPEIESKFKELAHSIGLTADQAKALTEFEMSLAPSDEEIAAAQEAYDKKAKATLEAAWGADYDNRAKVTLDVLNKYGEKYPDAVNELKAVVGNNPALRIILADLAETFQEKGTPVGTGRVEMSADQANQRIKDLQADTGFMQAYLNGRHPGHAQAVEKMNQLYQKKHGG